MKIQLLRQVPLFARLSDDELRLIERLLRMRTYRAGDLVFSEGDASDAVYLVASGSLEVVPDAAPGRPPLDRLEAGSFFGDVALVSDRPRTTTVRVTSPQAELWVLNKADFQDLLAEHPILAEKIVVARRWREEPGGVDPAALQALRSVPALAGLSTEALVTLASYLRRETFAAGDWIYRPGSPAQALYLIADGAVKIVAEAQPEAPILDAKGRGEVFGLRSLTEAARAITNVSLWRLSRNDLNLAITRYPAIQIPIASLIGAGAAATTTSGRPITRPSRPTPATVRPWSARIQDNVSEAVSWFKGRPRLAQVRIAVVVLLLLYLFLISAPATVLSAVSPVTENMGARLALLVASPTPTHTPTLPATHTPLPTNTPNPTATATPVPTPTETPVPTLSLIHI